MTPTFRILDICTLDEAIQIRKEMSTKPTKPARKTRQHMFNFEVLIYKDVLLQAHPLQQPSSCGTECSHPFIGYFVSISPSLTACEKLQYTLDGSD
jgi:hypothetical protein